MRARVRRWGNSASIRIPAAILQAARLELDAPVDIREEGGCIVIAPIREPEVALSDLLAGITDNNLHAAADFGEAVGGEAL